jgi:hypothetical protein
LKLGWYTVQIRIFDFALSTITIIGLSNSILNFSLKLPSTSEGMINRYSRSPILLQLVQYLITQHTISPIFNG